MPRKRGSTRAIVEARLEQVDEMLSAGVASGRIEIALSKQHKITRRQVRSYIATVDARRAAETQAEAPYRRERTLRKIQRLEARCVAEGKYGPAAQLLIAEARLSGAFAQPDAESEALIVALGPPPADPTLALLWVQRCLLITLYSMMRNGSIDLVLKLRLISEYGGKLGLMNTRTILEDKLRRLEQSAGLRDEPIDAEEIPQ